MSTASTNISLAQARRIAVRVRALKGSVRTVRDCVRRLVHAVHWESEPVAIEKPVRVLARFLGVRDVQWP